MRHADLHPTADVTALDPPGRFGFAWDPAVTRLSRRFGITPESCGVDVDADSFEARFGRWTVRTPRSNVVAAVQTGPYRRWKVAGPPHLSLADLGLTFATTTASGVCVQFREPVAGPGPLGLIRHPSLTVTVDDPAALIAALAVPAAVAHRPTPLGQRIVHGAVAGAAGAVAMTPVMFLARQLSADVDAINPQVITASMVRAVRAPGWLTAPATAAAHLAFGAGNGAVFGAVAPRLSGPHLARATVFATAVMLTSYEGWVPALGILPPQHRQSRARALSVAASHLVYGAVLARLVGNDVADSGRS